MFGMVDDGFAIVFCGIVYLCQACCMADVYICAGLRLCVLNGACAGPHLLCAEGALRLWCAALPMHVTNAITYVPLLSSAVLRCYFPLSVVAIHRCCQPSVTGWWCVPQG